MNQRTTLTRVPSVAKLEAKKLLADGAKDDGSNSAQTTPVNIEQFVACSRMGRAGLPGAGANANCVNVDE